MIVTQQYKDEAPLVAAFGASDNVTPTIGNNVMNTLTTTNQVVTMSSIDFLNNIINPARLLSNEKEVENRHFVTRIEDELDDLGVAENFYVTTSQGAKRKVKGYILSMEQMTLVGMRESKAVRRSVLEKLKSLEKPSIDPMVALNDPAFLRDALISYTEKVMHLEHQVEEMKPDVDALTRIAKAEGSLCVTDAAKQLQVKPKSLFDLMSHSKWIYRRLGTAWIAYQDKIQQGLLEHKVTVVKSSTGEDKQVSQVRVTAKGLSKLAKLLSMEVMA